ncbi:hypothetical protein BO71DRAFT_70701 [Aspergillus ellipticus CBS 707.79]|uniref:Uncharacterized protein n=1 Tax=Aspergillus ellipticus CBS 707.79 TaxID=1448320 RepID=A0A319E360_9EURO|nr:hypothetical protein BO71DRAFT_70701 [Aspergillus ellipticus CBS 707.79]
MTALQRAGSRLGEPVPLSAGQVGGRGVQLISPGNRWSMAMNSERTLACTQRAQQAQQAQQAQRVRSPLTHSRCTSQMPKVRPEFSPFSFLTATNRGPSPRLLMASQSRGALGVGIWRLPCPAWALGIKGTDYWPVVPRRRSPDCGRASLFVGLGWGLVLDFISRSLDLM